MWSVDERGRCTPCTLHDLIFEAVDRAAAVSRRAQELVGRTRAVRYHSQLLRRQSRIRRLRH
ncbi:MAG: hypothetical protein C5B57_02245 [Blastocatellia bacterium]|nr:MAG: hypothetical protein C5B57_02245 [Blastocatellia bacterium]